MAHIVTMSDESQSATRDAQSATVNPQSAIRESPLELRDSAVACASPTKAAEPPTPEVAPEPWSHPWHDQLGLLYHRAITDKLRRQPALLEVAKENLRRWIAAEPDTTPSQARREWQRILDTETLEEIIRLMTDPTEEGHRRRQSTPFAGILTPEERRAIRDQLL
jgi:hypothetical protein